MRFKADRTELLSALKKCSRLSRKKSLIQMTDCVMISLIEGDDKGPLLSLRATDMEVWIEVRIPVECEQWGAVAPLCSTFERICAAIDHDSVIAEVKDGVFIVYPGDYSGKYPVHVPKGQFPEPQKEDLACNFDKKTFLWENSGIIERVLAKSNGSPNSGSGGACEIQSVLFCGLGGKTLTAAHLRGHSGGLEKTSIPAETGKFDIPVQGALMIASILGPVMLEIAPKWITATNSKISLVIRRTVQEGRAAEHVKNASSVVKSFGNSISVNRPDLTGAIRRVLLCEEENKFAKAIFLEFSENGLTVAGETGGGVEEIKQTAFTGKASRVLLAAGLIENQLAQAGDEITLSYPDKEDDLNGSSLAVRINDTDNPDYVGFVVGMTPKKMKEDAR